MKGAMGKRFAYLLASVFRLFMFFACLIAYIVVKLAVKPPIPWLNALLLCLSIGGLISGAFNLIMCGYSAYGYKKNITVQICDFILTFITGGIIGTSFAGIGLFTRVQPGDIESEGIAIAVPKRSNNEEE